MLKKKYPIVLLLIALTLLLSGCSSNVTNMPEITSESTGFWSQYFVYPLSWLITKIAHTGGFGYGIAIVVVTLIVRTVLLPLYIKQTRSSKAMQALQPEIKKLREKYSSKDQVTQQQLQKETMELFKENKVNPLSGCLPILVQMPILFAFYQAIMRTKEIATESFLWFDLGDKDPYYILPVVAALTTFLQQKIMMMGQTQEGAMAQQMKVMLYLMPAMIFMFAISFPAALSLYWVVGNIYSIVQTYLIKGPDIKAAASLKNGGNSGGKK